MNPIAYARAQDVAAAIATAESDSRAYYLAGGTNVIDLMKDDVEAPSMLIDITRLPMHDISADAASVRLGALSTMADVADAPAVKAHFPAVSQALLQSASPQLRNMATIGGNVLQRTRCAYFRDVSQPCNKRRPGLGCSAIAGENRFHAVIGTSPNCICTHASDFAVALMTTDARVHTRTSAGTRVIAFENLHVLPGDRPNIETVLRPGELIEAIELPLSDLARNSIYVKVRDRASYEFALVSVAAALDISGGRIRAARIALGGVAPKPWRLHEVEAALTGAPAGASTYARAAELASRGMRGFGKNNFKIPLARNTVEYALGQVGGTA